MLKNFDVTIIGGGIAGIMAGYELINTNPSLKVAIIEQGTSLEKRVCPINAKKTTKCIGCKSCMRIGCPAVSIIDGKVKIDNTLCTGCGICSQLCKVKAIGGNE